MAKGSARDVYTPVRKVPDQPGKYFNKYGYVLLRVKPGLFVLEHRHIVESVLGRKLTRDEEVNHIDGVKSNNDNRNLFVSSASYHNEWHHRCYRRFGTWHPPLVRDPARVSQLAFESGRPLSNSEQQSLERGSDTVTRKSTGRPDRRYTREDTASIFRKALGLW
jgi:hypothetical protein